MAGKVIVDQCGFIYVDGVKIGKLTNRKLEFMDKDVNRSKLRGSRFVYITPEELVEEVNKALQQNKLGLTI